MIKKYCLKMVRAIVNLFSGKEGLKAECPIENKNHVRRNTEQEWEKLLYGVIFDGILHKVHHKLPLSVRQQEIVDMFPDYKWI